MTPAISRYNRSRFWAVRDAAGVLVCVCVYKRGAMEVARRLAGPGADSAWCLREAHPAGNPRPIQPLQHGPQGLP